MIKVLTIATAHFENDGITNSILNYYRNIDKSKISMDFVIPNKLCDRIQNEFIKNKTKYYELPERNRKPIQYILDLKHIIQEGKYNIIHAHGSSSILLLEMYAGYLAKCNIRIAHSHNTKTNHPIINEILKNIFRRSYTEAFACGKEAGEWLFGKDKNVIIIPNGKNCEEFKFNKENREKIRKKYNLEDKIVIGHVGRFNYQKNHEFLIDIFNNLKKKSDKYYLILAGTGKLEENIRNKVKKLGLENSVLFLGEVTNINEWLNAMDIMLLPSRFEGLPVVSIEWQISGLPCIISDKVTKEVKLTDLVQFESIDNPEKWVDKILKIQIKDRNKLNYIEEIKKAGYDIKENAKKLEEIYYSLLEKRN